MPRLSDQELNARRRQAVQLRQEGASLEHIRNLTGLSHPTIIAAHKAFQQGGWEAVRTARRGRRHGDAPPSLPPEVETALRQALLTSTPAREGLAPGLWQLPVVADWLQQHHGLRLKERSLARWLHLQGFHAPAWLDRHRQHPARPHAEWLEQVYTPLARDLRSQGHATFWIGESPLVDGNGACSRHNLLFAHTPRGRLLWLATRNWPSPADWVQFLDLLVASGGGQVLAVTENHTLEGFPAIRDWLQQHRPQLTCLTIPAANPEPPPPPHQSPRSNTSPPMNLTHLQRLEAESIHIMREVVAEADNPVMLYSIGKDSAVMLHLAMKAFYPAKPPFPLLHVDTGWKFRDMYVFRDRMAQELGLDLLVHTNPEGIEKGINPFTHGSAIHTDIMKTEGLKQALDKYGFDAAFGGARRDEEKSRAKERIFSFRTAQHRWDPKSQRPELWKLYNARKHKGESIRVFPLSNWTELDIWQYIYLENIPIVPLYFSAVRPVVERDGTLIMVDDERMPLRPDEVPMMKKVRFRTLGCYPLTGAVESEADTLPAIIQEMLLTKTSERQGRVIDHDSAASMEKKKQEGYF